MALAHVTHVVTITLLMGVDELLSITHDHFVGNPPTKVEGMLDCTESFETPELHPPPMAIFPPGQATESPAPKPEARNETGISAEMTSIPTSPGAPCGP